VEEEGKQRFLSWPVQACPQRTGRKRVRKGKDERG